MVRIRANANRFRRQQPLHGSLVTSSAMQGDWSGSQQHTRQVIPEDVVSPGFFVAGRAITGKGGRHR